MIKNKNGEEYKISKPNPLMKFQELWSIYTLHNFFWNETIEKNKNIKQIKEKINEIEKEEIKPDLEVKEEIKPELEIKEEIKEENITSCYYLGAENISIQDELYGDKKNKIKYNQKKIINIKLDSYNDLFLYFTYHEKLEKNSIIFPKNKDKRWWKINKINNNQDSYNYECIPSDFTPSFS